MIPAFKATVKNWGSQFTVVHLYTLFYLMMHFKFTRGRYPVHKSFIMFVCTTCHYW